jgi:hypothetical protein
VEALVHEHLRHAVLLQCGRLHWVQRCSQKLPLHIFLLYLQQQQPEQQVLLPLF